ncbi:hypothetical protein PR048_017737 [Dryococelus australis]|uniref:Uncharacterized protein n=1 Tax=Dryococelus australis TaxID=614101 RepID=A0ABQ9HAI2_9NEOP|nr:hypothetical protein PR048_017737 [Dryococelus australis]
MKEGWVEGCGHCGVEMEVALGKFIVLRQIIRRKKMQASYRLWVHPINVRRHTYGAFAHLFPDLVNYPLKFFNFFRMKYETFVEFNNLVRDEIVTENTNYHQAIQPEHKYVTAGESFSSLSYTYRMGVRTVHDIVLEFNAAIWNILQPT